MGILNSGGNEKLKSGSSSDSEYGSCGGESDHWVSGEDGDGELVSDGIGGGGLDGSFKSKRLSHEADHGPFSVWLGVAKVSRATVSGCSGNSGRVSVGELVVSKKVDQSLVVGGYTANLRLTGGLGDWKGLKVE
jgi:hypothetical protein